MHPNPRAETCNPVFQSFRFCIPFSGLLHLFTGLTDPADTQAVPDFHRGRERQLTIRAKDQNSGHGGLSVGQN
jgi:hypothetical protein